METFQRILLYADPNAEIEPALQYAARFARDGQGVLTVADCLPNDSPPKPMTPLAQREAHTRLNKICEQLHAQGVLATAKLLVGQPTREIIREVACNGHDIVMKTAQATASAKKRLSSARQRLL